MNIKVQKLLFIIFRSFSPLDRSNSHQLFEVSVKRRICCKSTFVSNICDWFICFLQKFTRCIYSYSINVLQWRHFHIRCKNSSEMRFTDMAAFGQTFYFDILHIMIRHKILYPCNHICKFYFFFFNSLFFRSSVQSGNFHKK